MDIMTYFLNKIEEEDNFLNKIKGEDKIDYFNINEEFLYDLNKILYYLNFNKKDAHKNKNFYEFYQYLCKLDNIKEKHKYLDGVNPITYFIELKEIINEHDNEYEKNIIINTGENMNKNEEILKIKNNEKINNNGKNENSTRSSSDINGNNSNINNLYTSTENQGLINNSSIDQADNNNFSNIQDLVRKEITKYFGLYSKYNNLKILFQKYHQ